jgi:pimeloyl-ACP methyl ester carboxylesterase
MRPQYIFALILAFISQTSNAQVHYGDNKEAGNYLNTRGFKIYYEIYGQGEPLLFIHGNGGSINSFANNIPYFSEEYKVIAVDSRSHGKSVDTNDSLTFEMMADDFNALLDSLHLDSCYVIGWSDGGINGLLLAIRHSDKVKKLAITGANLWPDTTGLTPFVFSLIQNESDSLRKKTQTPDVKNKLKLTNLDLYEPHIKLEQLNAIQCPTLVIGGDHDVIPVLHTVLIAANIPKSYLWILPNSGHSTPIFEKNQFNAAIADFLAKPYRKIEGVATFK